MPRRYAGGGGTSRAIAQMNPVSSRAMAIATFGLALLLPHPRLPWGPLSGSESIRQPAAAENMGRPDAYTESAHAFHASNPGRQCGTEQPGIGRLVGDAAHRGESEVDR